MPRADTCGDLESRGVFRQISRDLERYTALGADERALLEEFCAFRRKACIRLRVSQGVPYVLDLWPGYQSRHRATLLALHRVFVRLGPVPDVEVVIDLSDGELQNIDLPIFVITHRVDSPRGVLYPDFTFFSWPESACPPAEPSHAHAHLMARFASNATPRALPWRNRSDVLFWRGARVDDGGGRQAALRHLAEAPGTDAEFVAWRAVSSTARNEVPGCVGLLEQCRFRYLAFLAGTTYSSRLKFQLACGSTVLSAEPAFAEWWTHLLRPGVHYAPVAPDWSDSGAVLRELRGSPRMARGLAARGQRLALRALTAGAADCYWWRLLAAAAAVLPRPAGPVPRHARPLDDALLWPEGVVLSAELGGPAGGAPPALVLPPRDLADPTCFADGRLRWSQCCNTEAYGPEGDAGCWDPSAGLDFGRCCLSEGRAGAS